MEERSITPSLDDEHTHTSNTSLMKRSELRRKQRLDHKIQKCLSDPIAQAQVRRSALLVAEQMQQSLRKSSQRPNNTKNTRNSIAHRDTILPHIPSFDMSVASSSVGYDQDSKGVRLNEDVIGKSEHSSERATQRGSRRGARERNEVLSLLRDIGGDEDGLQTFTTDGVTDEDTDLSRFLTQGHGDRRRKRLFTRQQKKRGAISKSLHEVKDERTKKGDAWMCGVCGNVFATFDAAGRHEQAHIEEVVWSLGWSLPNNNQNDSRQSGPPVSEVFRHRTLSEEGRRRSPGSHPGRSTCP